MQDVTNSQTVILYSYFQLNDYSTYVTILHLWRMVVVAAYIMEMYSTSTIKVDQLSLSSDHRVCCKRFYSNTIACAVHMIFYVIIWFDDRMGSYVDIIITEIEKLMLHRNWASRNMPAIWYTVNVERSIGLNFCGFCGL